MNKMEGEERDRDKNNDSDFPSFAKDNIRDKSKGNGNTHMKKSHPITSPSHSCSPKPSTLRCRRVHRNGKRYQHDRDALSGYNTISMDDRDRKGLRKKSSNKRKKSDRSRYSGSNDDISSEDTYHREKSKKSDSKKQHKMNKHKHRSRHDYHLDDSSHKERRRKRKSDSKKHHKMTKHYHRSNHHDCHHDNSPQVERRKRHERDYSKTSFGKYGIVKESDYHQNNNIRRSFEMWLSEVKGIPHGTNLPKNENTNYFKDYAEDFNTSTLPHKKYYDYNMWEIKEYEKQKKNATEKKGMVSNEFQYQEEMRRKYEEKKKREIDIIKGSMNSERMQEMKRQAALKAEMMIAYKVGDEEKRKKLQKRLEPEERRWR